MIPGEYVLRPEPVVINAGRPTTEVDVVNRGDRPVQVGSHFHFAEANPGLEFDRAAARGFRLHPGEDAVAGLGFLGGRTHLGSLLVVDPRVDRELVDEVHGLLAAAEKRLPGLRCGVSELPVPGLVLRALGPGSAKLTDLLLDVSALLRARWTGQPRVALRKY